LAPRFALVEKHLLGGDCLNVGCVPSKSRHSFLARRLRRKDGRRFRRSLIAPPQVDFPSVMERMRKLRADISPHDSAERFAKLGVDVFLGAARFAGPDTVEVRTDTCGSNGLLLRLAARAQQPPIPGLAEAGYLTNETVFSLTQCPARLAVIGGGPIGCELAQAFQRLGSQVSLFHKNAHLLDREDMDAAAIVQSAFIREGVAVPAQRQITRVERNGVEKRVCYEAQGKEEAIVVDEILAGAAARRMSKGSIWRPWASSTIRAKACCKPMVFKPPTQASTRPVIFAWPGSSLMPPISPPES